MVPEGNEAAAASGSDGRQDETGRAGGATLAAGGRRAEAEGDGSRGREMTRPVSLPLELGPVPPAPSGMLAPLFQDVPQGPGSVGHRALLAGELQHGRSDQVQRGDQGNRLLALDGQTTVRRGSGDVNPFWSSEAKKDVFASGQGRLPSDVNLARSLQPVMDAAGSGRSGLDLDEGELERIRQRVLREAEENFKMEIRKLKGEGGTDSRSYHSASSGGDQGAPHAAQGDRAGLGSSTTPSRGDRVGLASMATPIHGGAAVNGTPGQGLQGVVSPPGLDQRGFLQGGVQGGHGESLKSYELPPLPVPGSEGASLPLETGLHLPVHKCRTSERLQGIGGSLSCSRWRRSTRGGWSLAQWIDYVYVLGMFSFLWTSSGLSSVECPCFWRLLRR